MENIYNSCIDSPRFQSLLEELKMAWMELPPSLQLIEPNRWIIENQGLCIFQSAVELFLSFRSSGIIPMMGVFERYDNLIRHGFTHSQAIQNMYGNGWRVFASNQIILFYRF